MILRRMCQSVLVATSLMLGPAGAQADNPDFQGADPFAMFIGNELWVFPTGGPDKSWGPNRLGIWSSSDLESWKSRGEAIRSNSIPWIDEDGAPRHFLWAPSVLQQDGRWYFYYSVGPQKPTPSRIGVGVADRPEGPYWDSGQPLLTGGDGFEAIDPMVFVDPKTKTPYLYAGGSAGATLRVFELNTDLVSVRREVKVDQPPQFTEGVFMHERGGIYYLSYSHGKWKSAGYSVHYATAPSPTGPWTYRGPIMISDELHQGPGHHSFVRDPKTGDWLIVYHRWEGSNQPDTFKGKRDIAIDRITYGADGNINPVKMTDGAMAPGR